MDNKVGYRISMNKVMNYIDKYFYKKISLDDLSRVGNYSVYHMHRIFSTLIDESLHQYILRIRLEKAACCLIQTKLSITQVALKHGFYDGAAFSKHFKNYFGMPPSEYKKNSKNIQENKTMINYNDDEGTYECTNESLVYENRQCLFYKRFQGDFRGQAKIFVDLYMDVLDWKSKQILNDHYDSKSIVIYHDPLDITSGDKLRISVGVTMPLDFKSNEMSRLILQKGFYKVFKFILRGPAYDQAWRYAYKQLLKDEALLLRDDYAYEVYPKKCYDHKKNETHLEIWIPVEKRKGG